MAWRRPMMDSFRFYARALSASASGGGFGFLRRQKVACQVSDAAFVRLGETSDVCVRAEIRGDWLARFKMAAVFAFSERCND